MVRTVNNDAGDRAEAADVVATHHAFQEDCVPRQEWQTDSRGRRVSCVGPRGSNRRGAVGDVDAGGDSASHATGAETGMGIACQAAPETEGGHQSDLVPPQPRSRKGSKVKMAMNCEEMVGLVATTPEMVEIVSPSTGNSGAGGVQQHDSRTS